MYVMKGMNMDGKQTKIRRHNAQFVIKVRLFKKCLHVCLCLCLILIFRCWNQDFAEDDGNINGEGEDAFCQYLLKNLTSIHPTFNNINDWGLKSSKF